MRREELYCGEVLDQLDGSVAASSVPAPASQDYLTGIPPAIHAYKDPVILEDSRVFHNMLEIEEFYIAATNYFQAVQSEILPHMRKMVTDWMLEVCWALLGLWCLRAMNVLVDPEQYCELG